MPTYDFECPKGHTTEGFYSMQRRPKTIKRGTCPEKATRIFSAGNGPPIFKGTGFYETDYKRKRKRK